MRIVLQLKRINLRYYRMFNELQQVGLKDPVYYTYSFMLQAMIYDTNIGKTMVEKTSDSFRLLAVAVNQLVIDSQKPAIENEKRAVDDIKSAIEQQKYNEPTKVNILKVYDEIDENKIIELL